MDPFQEGLNAVFNLSLEQPSIFCLIELSMMEFKVEQISKTYLTLNFNTLELLLNQITKINLLVLQFS